MTVYTVTTFARSLSTGSTARARKRHQQHGPDRWIVLASPSCSPIFYQGTASSTTVRMAPIPASTIRWRSSASSARHLRAGHQRCGPSRRVLHGFRQLHEPPPGLTGSFTAAAPSPRSTMPLAATQHLCLRHQQRGPDRRVLLIVGSVNHGFTLRRQHLHHPRRSVGRPEWHLRLLGINNARPDRRELQRRQRPLPRLPL